MQTHSRAHGTFRAFAAWLVVRANAVRRMDFSYALQLTVYGMVGYTWCGWHSFRLVWFEQSTERVYRLFLWRRVLWWLNVRYAISFRPSSTDTKTKQRSIIDTFWSWREFIIASIVSGVRFFPLLLLLLFADVKFIVCAQEKEKKQTDQIYLFAIKVLRRDRAKSILVKCECMCLNLFFCQPERQLKQPKQFEIKKRKQTKKRNTILVCSEIAEERNFQKRAIGKPVWYRGRQYRMVYRTYLLCGFKLFTLRLRAHVAICTQVFCKFCD